MQHRVTEDLETEPVTLAEAKAHLVVDFTADDALITEKITTAREWLEQYTGLAFAEKTIEVYFDSEDTDLSLPVGPVIGDITSVVRTVNSEDTTLTTADYSVKGLKFKKISFNNVWTSCGLASTTHLVEYQAGYNDEFPLPKPLKEAILKLVAELYRDRENTISGNVGSSVNVLPHHVRALASPYRQNVWL